LARARAVCRHDPRAWPHDFLHDGFASAALATSRMQDAAQRTRHRARCHLAFGSTNMDRAITRSWVACQLERVALLQMQRFPGPSDAISQDASSSSDAAGRASRLPAVRRSVSAVRYVLERAPGPDTTPRDSSRSWLPSARSFVSANPQDTASHGLVEAFVTKFGEQPGGYYTMTLDAPLDARVAPLLAISVTIIHPRPDGKPSSDHGSTTTVIGSAA